MKINKSDMLYKYVIEKNRVIDIEEIFKEFHINKNQFNKLKFRIKSNYSEQEYINFLNYIKGPKLLLLKNQIHIDIPNFIIDNNLNKEYILNYFDMTNNEFCTMLQNLKKSDIDKYNKVLFLLKKNKSGKTIKKNINKFNKITNFIIENNCGYYDVCKELKMNDSSINYIINSNKEKYPEIVNNVKKILKQNKVKDKYNFNDITVFNDKNKLNTLKYLIINKQYSISDLSLYFLIRYNKMNSFINYDLKSVNKIIYDEINNYLNSNKIKITTI